MLAVFDFWNQSIDQVIDKALVMDRNHKNKKSMDMSALHHNLPTLEELQFRQAVQCTTCLNTGHSTIESNLHTHCTVCHSKAHSVEQCVYNLLNKVTSFLRQIHPEDFYQANRNMFIDRSLDDDRYDNRYYSDRWDESRRQNNDNNRNDYKRNDSYDLSPDEDQQNDYRRDNRDQDYSPPRENGHRQYRGGRYQENRK